jgi:integrase
MKYKYDKTNKLYYYNSNGRKITHKTQDGLSQKLREAGILAKQNGFDKFDVTVRDAFNLFLTEHSPPKLREKTYLAYKSYIRCHYGYDFDRKISEDKLHPFMIDNKNILNKKLIDIDIRYILSVLKLLRERHGNRSNTSINHWYGIFKNVLSYAYEANKMPENPTMSKDLKFKYVRPKAWCPSKKEATDVMQIIDQNCEPDAQLFVHLCARGLRSSEALGLKKSAIDFSKRKFEILQGVDENGNIHDPKSESSHRFVKMDTQLFEIMQNYCKDLGYNQWLFTSNYRHRKGKPTTARSLRAKGIDKALEIVKKQNPDFNWDNHKQGTNGYRPIHSFRHFFVSNALEVAFTNKKSIKWVSNLVGHSSPMTTLNIYGHIIDEDDENIADELNPMKRSG